MAHKDTDRKTHAHRDIMNRLYTLIAYWTVATAAFRLATPFVSLPPPTLPFSSLPVKTSTRAEEKKVISIPPCGFLGFYVLGMTAYMKDHFDLSRFVFAGDASGGWNALFLSCRRDPLTFALGILENPLLRSAETLQEWEFSLKSHLLMHYNNEDFDLESLFIGVPFWQECFQDSMLVKPARSLEDAVQGCLTRMPFPWGPVPMWGDVKKSDWILWNRSPHVCLRPDMWNEKKNSMFDFYHYYQRCAIANARGVTSPSQKLEIVDLFDRGYADAMEHAADWDRLLGEDAPRKFP